MGLTARDLMQSQVLTLDPTLSLVDAQRLFVEEGIGGAPVVGDSGSVVGVVSSTDLLRAVEEEHDTGVARGDYFREFLPYAGPDWRGDTEDFQDRLGNLTVSDVMTKDLVTVPDDASIADVARTLHGQGVHRVLVVAGGRLAGIITSSDFVSIFV